ncbi:MerR family transcriptional regulator [Thiothrix subterranea]|uniref:MerR family transcriptional regulator n=1 Tax=Thiothrix subterranea TaxID=2735563 RepID=A0ABU0YAP9_9GAMM|nr:MerR family transcriptional regulator [Thiothrix subterranea]MDQ5769855.1 MerR family transcriptional regulator [Thiothrix subterranea]
MTFVTDHNTSDITALFPIGTVSEQTGVNTVTLRAWERRYGLLKPRRTPKGHRLYSRQDVDRVKQVLVLLEQGIPVGRVRDVLDSGETPPMHLRTAQDVQTDDPWRHYCSLFQRCIHKLDTRSLEHTFNEAVSLYSLELVAKKLILPLYQQLWQQQAMLPSTRADYAFLHEFLCVKLGSRYLHYNSRANGKRVLLVNTQTHAVQLETLLLANIISQHGYQVSLLGTETTLDHLPLIIERAEFDALLLPSTDVSDSLQALSIMTQITVFLSGEAKPESQPGTAPLRNIHWLPEELSEICLTLDKVLAKEPAHVLIPVAAV